MRLLDEGIPGVPKVISPQQHMILDFLTIGAFGLAGALMWGSNRRAGLAAFLNGAFVLGFTLLTDYNGDGSRPLSFKTHGKLDEVQAGLAAAAPTVLAFSEEKKSWFFRGQAANEVLVLAMTDFPAAERRRRVLDRAA
jgi:hypothetical protein